MKCAEAMSITELKTLISVGSWSDSALSMILDGATDFIFSLLGHSFGRAIRIYHSEEEDATAATISVTATGVSLIITGGANAGTTTYLFVDYTDMIDLVEAINQADLGFEATLVEGMSPTEKTENLHTLAATNCLGLSNRVVLCIQQTTEVMDGTGTGYIFTHLPIKSVVSLIQDGMAINSSSYWAKTGGYVLYKYASGSQYEKYSLDYFSLKTPCNIQICYVPLWLRIPGFFKLILRAMCGHTILSTGVKSESIGDYSVTYGEIEKIIALWWPMMAEYMVGFCP